MSENEIRERLEYLRGEIEAERISLGEIAELQSLADHIEDDDVVLLEWAGRPEDAETWIIETWTGRHVFVDKTFASFEEARGFIAEYAASEGKSEDEENGICEDLYAVLSER